MMRTLYRLCLCACFAMSLPTLSHAAQLQSVGKERAPVRIAGSASASTAQLSLTLEVAVDSLTVQVYGVDGLQVLGPATPVQGGPYSAGAVIPLAVEYAAPLGESELVVSVQGRFRGRQRAMTQSFTVRKVDVPLLTKPSAKQPVTDSQGAPIRVMPGQSRRN